jgi:beta-mannosidase
LDAHLPAPRDFDDWHFLTQLNQARAVGYGIEHFRSLRPYCMGAIMWQLNDCWPVTSWAAVDGDGRRKPLWYALRDAFADRLLTWQPRDGVPALVAVNDSTSPWVLSAVVSRRTLDGVVLASVTLTATVPPGAARTMPFPGDNSDIDLLLAEADGERAWWFFAEDRDVRWPAAAFDGRAERVGDTVLVTVRARTILRDLTLFADRVAAAATVDESAVTLLPGESATFTVRGAGDADPAAFTTRPALRCVNDLPTAPGV